jgi:glutathione S-transferase
VEPALLEIFMNKMQPADQRDEKLVRAGIEKLKTPLKVLDDHLCKSNYLLGKEFTIADLNVASVMSLAPLIQLDLSAAPAAQAWLQKCLGRPANQRAVAMK